ncbi:MAG: hypothetical protein C4527_01325 [Candidatus Omnitrophota bacterium]|jgi:streptogramin lyase|nr:MAG: hypothetical protein C4527_01325 [Candidatus Omnitrophota bacterium]
MYKQKQSLLFVSLLFFPLAFAAQMETVASQDVEIRDIGIPVRSVNWVRLHLGFNRDGNACLYSTMGQNGDELFVLQIDPATGKFRQFVADVPNANFPTATLMSRAGKLYVGAAYAGHLLCFDRQKDTFEDLGAINPGGATFPCRMDEDAEGNIWIGSYGTADLTCFNPKTGEFTPYGRMDDVDMYNYPLVNTDGMIANLIRMTKPHVVVFDPKTGKKQVVGPVTTKGKEEIDLRKGNDKRLYIVSSVGNFRIDGMEAIAVDAVPDPPAAPTLADGSTFSFTDGSEQMYRKLEIRKPDGAVASFELNYEASGSDIFYLHAGPDGCVYGSSILPLHLFRYHPTRDELVDLGKCSAASGEAYSMANLDGKMYISSYPAAMISVYDPAEPYHYGAEKTDNPRDLGRIDEISYRPRSTLAGPMGRVWVASIPDYGLWGGPLSYFDPATEEKKAFYRIVGDGSCYTLAHLEKEKLLAVGTSISGGSGTQAKVDQAVLFLFDYEKGEKIWEGTPDRPVSVFNALVAAPDGRLFGTISGKGEEPQIFSFDPQSRAFGKRIALPSGRPLDLGLQVGADKMIYGFTSTCFYRLDPNSFTTEVLFHEAISVPGPIVGESVYFSTGHLLRSAHLLRIK